MSNIVIIIGDHEIGSTLTAKYYDTLGNELEFQNDDIEWFEQDSITSQKTVISRYTGMRQIQVLKPIMTYITAEIQGNSSQIFLINRNIVTPTFQESLPNVGNGISLDVPVSKMSGLSSETTNIGRINQSLELILNTAKGEYPMLPNFGCNLNKVLFYTIQTESDLESIKQDLFEDLSRQEPRINIKDLQVGFDYIDTLLLIIEYTIRNTNITGNLIYNHKIGGEVNV